MRINRNKFKKNINEMRKIKKLSKKQQIKNKKRENISFHEYFKLFQFLQ